MPKRSTPTAFHSRTFCITPLAYRIQSVCTQDVLRDPGLRNVTPSRMRPLGSGDLPELGDWQSKMLLPLSSTLTRIAPIVKPRRLIANDRKSSHNQVLHLSEPQIVLEN